MYNSRSYITNVFSFVPIDNPGMTSLQNSEPNSSSDIPSPPAKLYPCNTQSSKPPQQQHVSILLCQQHRKIIHILGEGNCFFRSLSYFIYGTRDEHLNVRNDIVEFISRRKLHFSSLVIDPEGKETIEQQSPT